MAKNLKKTLRDVFGAGNFGGRGDLTELFRIEYNREYQNFTKSGVHVDDLMVKNYLKL